MDKVRDNSEKVNSLLDEAVAVINKAPDIKAAPHGPDVDCQWKAEYESMKAQLLEAQDTIRILEANAIQNVADLATAREEGRREVLKQFSKYGDKLDRALYAQLENMRDELSILRQRSDTVWVVSNSNTVTIFATEEDAWNFVGAQPASVGGGMSINGTILMGNKAQVADAAMLDAKRYRLLRDIGIRPHLHIHTVNQWFRADELDTLVDRFLSKPPQ